MDVLGRKVKPGEHAIKIRGSHLRLFHKSQTEIASTAERKEYFKSAQEKEARKAGKGQQQATA